MTGGAATDADDCQLLLTVPEVCARLRISRWSFYKLLQSRQLETVKIGSRRLVPVGALPRLLQRLQQDEEIR